MSGTIRIGNKRKGSAARPLPHETSIDGDRNNPRLGNPFVLHNHLDDAERARVIEAYRTRYETDWQNHGPMRQETEKIAERVRRGENIIIMCWCVGHPLNKPCHLQFVESRVRDILNPDGNYQTTVASHLESFHKLNPNIYDRPTTSPNPTPTAAMDVAYDVTLRILGCPPCDGYVREWSPDDCIFGAGNCIG